MTPTAPDPPAATDSAWRLLLRNRASVAGLVIIAVVVVAAIFGPLIAPYGANAIDVPNALQAPSWSHLFGTDDLGRDVFSRVVLAASVSLRVAVIAVAISLTVGVILGMVAGFAGGVLDTALMRIVDVVFSFPVLLLALAIVAVLGPGVTSAMIAIGVVYIPIFARVARADTLRVRQTQYVQSARTMGVRTSRILFSHVLPNISGPVIVQTSISLAFAILSEAALSFLGLGVQPPDPSWGRMLFDAQGFITTAWWMGVFPGLAILFTVFAFNLVGDGVRDVLDPRQRTLLRNRGYDRTSVTVATATPKPARAVAEDSVLDVEDLIVGVGPREIVHGISFTVARGETLGIVGESGSGKSLSVLAATGLFDAPSAYVRGSARLGTTEIVGATPSTLRALHGIRVGFVFQDPSSSLNPLLTVEQQLTEGPRRHLGLGRAEAHDRALQLLRDVNLPDPESRLRAYPHQLSGGQRQRVMIAIALACDPDLLIADEATTALDVTTQAQIIDLVADLQRKRGMAVVWISHDLGVIGRIADRVMVMRSGRIVQSRDVAALFDDPRDEYSKKLLDSRPLLSKVEERDADRGLTKEVAEKPVLQVSGLGVEYVVRGPTGRSIVHAIDGVDLEVARGRTLGIVGESGSGKSTVAGVVTGLIESGQGTTVTGSVTVSVDGREVEAVGVRGADEALLRRRVAMVFQDPTAPLDPRMTVAASIAEPLRAHGLASGRNEMRSRAEQLLNDVSLDSSFLGRYPHEMSGGQRQRVCIARALASEPEILILDESTASLDVSVQAGVLELLRGLQREKDLTFLFIAHDLAVVEQISDTVAVMQKGKVVETGPASQIMHDPETDYTRSLLAAVPPEVPQRA
ncbi:MULTISPECIES: ABC transporter ATP-binding protein/permease [Gordonia]|uniref:ABC transporter n=1 Tax=Gordonia alkanivorans CGMCC 6845 TaxID=1423140 RepID=W9DH16_9ACTN|nr:MULTISPECIES: dipeptide ABC transporter ATP-binding protein [Gordonia]ETA07757.1 ABC transporter [Gordonia alkanivorans CGMCC 6845]MDH3007619.1 dipeptide ABC transporter ATP-binding protein [Gordonia alkanivorans]MDH3015196.1 dipeptide ABC transporter ATP-binding protein [Gordonia alkanivorans]MDH3021290.1 dipeptide ABC transporter ATP-binding protein [Gordonia alkanivorans]MDH3024251.1 dipeptide ABC transporter ATP-binding protein [Gordonia alkanivorans]